MMYAPAPQAAVPDLGALVSGDGSSVRRILVPIRQASDAVDALAVAARVCSSTKGALRLVHVRIFDPPVRGASRFYPETVSEAAAVADEALPVVWAYGVRATTAVVAAPRGEVAVAIAQQATAWRADLIVMTRRPSAALWRLIMRSIPDQVMRRASCPVLAVNPKPQPSARRAGDARDAHTRPTENGGRRRPAV
jgi:nucleotide-binding universal stress UspA family protein